MLAVRVSNRLMLALLGPAHDPGDPAMAAMDFQAALASTSTTPA